MRNYQDLDQGQIHISISMPLPQKEWGSLVAQGVVPGNDYWQDKNNDAFFRLQYVEEEKASVSVVTVGDGIHPLSITAILGFSDQAIDQSATLCAQTMRVYLAVCEEQGLQGVDDEYQIATMRIRLDARGNRIGLIDIHIPKLGYKPITPPATIEEGKLKRLIRNAIESTNADGMETELPGERPITH